MKRCTKRLPLKYFRLEEDNYKYNNYIYGILKECKKLTENSIMIILINLVYWLIQTTLLILKHRR